MELYNYIFHFNCYTDIWSAIKREDYNKFFNKELSKNAVLQSKNIMDLVEIVKKIEKDA